MKHKLDKIHEEAQELCSDISSDLRNIKSNSEQIGNEYHRVTEMSRTPMVVIKEIDRQFEKATHLRGTDTAFLFVATGLQCFRQYFLTMMPTERPGDKEAAKLVKGESIEHSDRSHRLYNPSLEEILTNPVPFDLNNDSQGALKGYGYFGHRGATVGHDPLIGLVVGTANIATSTATLWGKEIPIKMDSFHVRTGLALGRNGTLHNADVFASSAGGNLLHANTSEVLRRTFVEKLFYQGIEGVQIVGCSAVKEYVHLQSDKFSKKSLPAPCVSAFSPQLAGELAKRGLDMANVHQVGKQFTYAVAIDALIAIIHGMLFNPVEGISRHMYEIRTRKILSYSNLIASASNVIVAAVAQFLDMDGKRIADWGGYINTLRHIAFDTKFIHEMKKDFLKNELCDRIVGSEYDFMKGDF